MSICTSSFQPDISMSSSDDRDRGSQEMSFSMEEYSPFYPPSSGTHFQPLSESCPPPQPSLNQPSAQPEFVLSPTQQYPSVYPYRSPGEPSTTPLRPHSQTSPPLQLSPGQPLQPAPLLPPSQPVSAASSDSESVSALQESSTIGPFLTVCGACTQKATAGNHLSPCSSVLFQSYFFQEKLILSGNYFRYRK